MSEDDGSNITQEYYTWSFVYKATFLIMRVLRKYRTFWSESDSKAQAIKSTIK